MMQNASVSEVTKMDAVLLSHSSIVDAEHKQCAEIRTYANSISESHPTSKLERKNLISRLNVVLNAYFQTSYDKILKEPFDPTSYEDPTLHMIRMHVKRNMIYTSTCFNVIVDALYASCDNEM